MSFFEAHGHRLGQDLHGDIVYFDAKEAAAMKEEDAAT
jgi:hypothetical protein